MLLKNKLGQHAIDNPELLAEVLISMLKNNGGLLDPNALEAAFGQIEKREPGSPTPADPPSTPEEWEALRTKSVEELVAMGLGNFGRADDAPGNPSKEEEEAWEAEGPTLMVFPGEWYDAIPKGYLLRGVVDSSFRWMLDPPFPPSKTTRWGFIPFGIEIPIKK